jgi:cardiolipin synthase
LRIARAIPSLLSAARLALTVPVAMATLDRRWAAALALAIAAALTDAADGWVARRWNLATRVGAWLDPLADKALMVTLFLCLGATGAVPVWLVALVFGRDAFILLMAVYALAFTALRDFPPSIWGKVSTWIQVVTACGALVRQAWPSPLLDAIFTALVVGTAAAAVISGVHYGRTGWRRLRSSR